MAFNFNWSPLTADASFYARARELLTGALNKYPKPPIIVDDILVNELNLGSIPPDLEILEVGDLAEDRFRGIFKMRYTGDAFLTLKTRVQANPLNTYLSTRPSFASPEPLSAAASLTIPLKITLSEIKLSAFIILVFSKQKGITLVFRNDPLESLKVSSTFDSIPFVRDYLQRTIEGQLRTLLMDEVPAIIHRLSLRLWVPEYREKEEKEVTEDTAAGSLEESIEDPLASPPQDPVDLNGRILDPTQIASLSLDSTAETHSLFSHKNLIRLAALADSQRTLSLFTPSMKDVVYRAWSGSLERGDSLGLNSPISPPLSRNHSLTTSTSMASAFSDSGPSSYFSARPPLSSTNSTFSSSSFGGKHSRTGRKRKHRVVNLRRTKTEHDDGSSISGDSATVSSSAASDSGEHPLSIPEDRELELTTPPTSPEKQKSRLLRESPTTHAETTPRPPPHNQAKLAQPQPLNIPPPPPFDPSSSLHSSTSTLHQPTPRPRPSRPTINRYFQSFQTPAPPSAVATSTKQSTSKPEHEYSSTRPHPPHHSTSASASSSSAGIAAAPSYPSLAAPIPYMDTQPGGILEQAWMMKMAGEIARRMQEQQQEQERKGRDGGIWGGEGEEAPPAYGA